MTALIGAMLASMPVPFGHAATPGVPIAQPELAALAVQCAEPLVPTITTTVAEDTALQAAITSYRNGAATDNFTPLESFLASHPGSGWNAALLTDLGLLYFHSGYLSKAIGAFEQAWVDGKSATETRARAVVDRAAGELLYMQARLGDADTLQTELNEIGGRSLSGPATELLAGARQVLWGTLHGPTTANSSGPKPLKNMLLAAGASPKAVGFLDSYRPSTPKTTLAQLGQLATQAQLSHRLIYRASGSAVPIPSIVHWKINHFAVIVGSTNGRYAVLDPAFGQAVMQITAGALETESSGFFLVSGEQSSPQWRDATTAEANQVFGLEASR